jgi:hypothetical protein
MRKKRRFIAAKILLKFIAMRISYMLHLKIFYHVFQLRYLYTIICDSAFNYVYGYANHL